MKSVTILIPAYNEAESLPVFFLSLRQFFASQPAYRWEALIVNDGSRDRTGQLIEAFHRDDPRFRFLTLSRNYGKEIALLAGFDHTRTDAVVIMDADMQHPLEVVPQMLAEWERGAQDVYATRYADKTEGWFKRTSSRKYYRLLRRLTRVEIPADTGDFRLLDRRCIDALCQMRESQRNTNALYCLIGFEKKQIFYHQAERLYGTTKWNFVRLFNLAVDGITSFTNAPLRLSLVLGLVVSFLAFLYMVFIIVKTLVWGDPVTGYPTLAVLILLSGGIQLIVLGVLGEYLGRIFSESKNRPLYFVSKESPTAESDPAETADTSSVKSSPTH